MIFKHLILTDSVSIALDGGVSVLQLDELVAHQSPRREVVRVQLERSLEVGHGLFVLRSEEKITPQLKRQHDKTTI